MARRSDREKYTDPELREQIKEEIKKSDKGGKKGQWSAQHQLLTRKDAGDMKGYLPKKAWGNMSDEENRETESKKRERSAATRSDTRTARPLSSRLTGSFS